MLGTLCIMYDLYKLFVIIIIMNYDNAVIWLCRDMILILNKLCIYG